MFAMWLVIIVTLGFILWGVFIKIFPNEVQYTSETLEEKVERLQMLADEHDNLSQEIIVTKEIQTKTSGINEMKQEISEIDDSISG